MIKLLHVISGLATGGAEMMLYKLLSRTNRRRFAPAVLALSGEHDLADRIRKLGVSVEILGMRRGIPRATDVVRLTRALVRMQPELIQTWMYHADLAVGLSSFLTRLPPIVWGIRAAAPRSGTHRPTTALSIRLSALLSRFVPTKIIYNSRRSCDQHVQIGYDRRKSVVIPNGFDLRTFRPRRTSRTEVRERLGIPPESPLIGMVARYHSEKDFPTFVRAAARLLESTSDVHFLLCGQGVTWENPELAGILKQYGLERRVHLLGARSDVASLMASLDIASLSSATEAFPNVIGEGMACGVPCVATDVGDTAFLIGNTGIVVPPSDPGALAAGWQALLAPGAQHRRKQGYLAYQRVRHEFSLDAIVSQYENAYLQILSGRSGAVLADRPVALHNRSSLG